MERRRHKRRKDSWMQYERRRGAFDRPLFFTTLGLMAFGCLMVYSASAPYAMISERDPSYFALSTLVFDVVGLLIMLFVSAINYRLYQRFSLAIYAISFGLCLLVFVPHIGMTLNNARRWIRLGSFTVMPSDILKIGSAIFLSAYLSRRRFEENGNLKTLGIVLLYLLWTILPVFRQPNFSAVMVISVTIMMIYFLGGMKRSHILIILVFAIIALTFAFWPHEGNYRLERLLTTFNPKGAAYDGGWHLLQSLYAVSSGGVFGVGFGRSRQKFGWLADEPHNDFIFSVICEEWGFLGAMALIGVFAFWVYRGIRIANRATTRFGRLLAYGLTFMVAFQALVNIGVAIGMVPTTGITLPFISYGGSSLMIMSGLAGILLNISRDDSRREQLYG